MELLNEGADSILLRKPGRQEEEYEQLLLDTDPDYYNRIMIAEHPALCERYNLQGIHFGEAARGRLTKEIIAGYRQKDWLLSTSIHSADTLQLASNDWDQLLLSPVFDSISKAGYKAVMDNNFRLDKNGYTGHVLALGGINHLTTGYARIMLFDGIALLGAIWEEPSRSVRNFCRIRDIWKRHLLM